MNSIAEFRKREIQNLKYYNNVIHGFELRIEEIDTIILGVKAIDPSHVPGGGKLDIHSLLTKKQQLQIELSKCQNRVDSINVFLDSLSLRDKKILIDAYFNNVCHSNIAQEHYMSKRKLSRLISEILESSPTKTTKHLV